MWFNCKNIFIYWVFLGLLLGGYLGTVKKDNQVLIIFFKDTYIPTILLYKWKRLIKSKGT